MFFQQITACVFRVGGVFIKIPLLDSSGKSHQEAKGLVSLRELRWPIVRFWNIGSILISPYQGQPLGTILLTQPEVGQQILSEILEWYQNFVVNSWQEYPLEQLERNPWKLAQSVISRLTDQEEKYPLIREVKRHLKEPETVLGIYDHGDFHVGNILIQKQSWKVIDPQYGLHIAFNGYLSLLYAWLFLYGSPEDGITPWILNQILQSVPKELIPDLKLMMIPTIMRVLNPTLIQDKFQLQHKRTWLIYQAQTIYEF